MVNQLKVGGRYAPQSGRSKTHLRPPESAKCTYMLTKINSQKDISVTTYRDGVPEGIAARAFYKRMGFVEGKLTEEFGSPVQEFVLKR